MQRRFLAGAFAAAAVAIAGLMFWPHSGSQAQINAEGCTCSRPSTLGAGREALAIYHCVCPGIQCVVTATQSGPAVPPQLAQSCK